MKDPMNSISYGLYVLTAFGPTKRSGCIVNTVCQVTAKPNRISVAVNKTNFTHDAMIEAGKFTVSVISEQADFSLFKHFGFQSGRDVNKFADYDMLKYLVGAAPAVAVGTNAYLTAQIIETKDLGTHTLFIADVLDAQTLSDAPSATYAYYHANIKPKPGAAAPEPEGKTVWRCKVCGYEYEGDELPEDFVCPWCKHPASDFEKV